MGRDGSLASDPAGASLVWCCGVLGYGQSLGTLTARIEMKPERSLGCRSHGGAVLSVMKVEVGIYNPEDECPLKCCALDTSPAFPNPVLDAENGIERGVDENLNQGSVVDKAE